MLLVTSTAGVAQLQLNVCVKSFIVYSLFACLFVYLFSMI